MTGQGQSQGTPRSEATTAEPDAVAITAASRDLGRDLSEPQARGLAAYLSQLMRWNKRMNLVGARTWQVALSDLAADSWHLADLLHALPLPPEPVTMDLGAGAGLPGLPLRLFWDSGQYLLVELRAKRAVFLRYALEAMQLPRTEVMEGRAEHALARRGPADLVLGRAFLPWREFLALVEGHVNCMALIMANEPPPQADDIPPGWLPYGFHAYPSGRGERYYWVFIPESASRSESLKINLVATASAFSPISMSRSRKSSSS